MTLPVAIHSKSTLYYDYYWNIITHTSLNNRYIFASCFTLTLSISSDYDPRFYNHTMSHSFIGSINSNQHCIFSFIYYVQTVNYSHSPYFMIYDYNFVRNYTNTPFVCLHFSQISIPRNTFSILYIFLFHKISMVIWYKGVRIKLFYSCTVNS